MAHGAVNVLSVAEKPSVAKGIANLLQNRPRSRPGKAKYNRCYDVRCQARQIGQCNMTVTSVLGHVMEYEWKHAEQRSWNGCDPFDLFDADVHKVVQSQSRDVAKNLRFEARKAQVLVLWLDCDREGESIATEVEEICKKVNKHLRVWRARFSAVTNVEVTRALNNLVELDRRQAAAVDARQELDFRLGCAVTRWQTKLLCSSIPLLQEKVISYGPCQLPTLGFVVDRYDEIEAFVPSAFWSTHMMIHNTSTGADAGRRAGRGGGSGGEATKFSWLRDRLFDRLCCAVLHEEVAEAVAADQCKVHRVDLRVKRRFKPKPLTTIELQKAASRWLRMSGERAMNVAEALYQKGFLSYPRTETDKFNPSIDLHALVRLQLAHPQWGDYATKLEQQGGFERPRDGVRDDEAHPPIHPTKLAQPAGLSSDERQVYEFVTRHFLACCSRDAVGEETEVVVTAADELFAAKGVIIRDKAWMEVYPYIKWNASSVPDLGPAGTVVPHGRIQLHMTDSETRPPPLLTEADLIALMDKNGIGTDATIADHIANVQRREYCLKDEAGHFSPSTLGTAIIRAYNACGAPVGKPLLRRQVEQDCSAICRGLKTKAQVVSECIQSTMPLFEQARACSTAFSGAIRAYLEQRFDEGNQILAATRARTSAQVAAVAAGGGAGAGADADADADAGAGAGQ